jgi:hypothetical protein
MALLSSTVRLEHFFYSLCRNIILFLDYSVLLVDSSRATRTRLFKLTNTQDIREKFQFEKKILKPKKNRSLEQTESTQLLLCLYENLNNTVVTLNTGHMSCESLIISFT